jgi:hypothetical protein
MAFFQLQQGSARTMATEVPVALAAPQQASSVSMVTRLEPANAGQVAASSLAKPKRANESRRDPTAQWEEF